MRTNLKDTFENHPALGTIRGRAHIIERNTFRYATTDNREVIRLHHTDIVESLGNGRFRLNSGGFKTITTKDRMNHGLRLFDSKFYVYSERGLWFVQERHSERQPIPFRDGMVIPDSFDLPAERKRAERAGAAALKLKARISAFVCETLADGSELPVPNGGDCLLCWADIASMDSDRNATFGSPDHIESHVKEKYMHGSLIRAAFRSAGLTDYAMRLYCYSGRPDHKRVRQIVRKYIGKRLGLVVR
jgi:hypothetical protein